MMERLFLECSLRAALLIAGAAIVLYATRVKPAALKHRVWTGVLALMLILPVWTAWGPKLALRVLPPAAQQTTNEAIVPAEIHGAASLPSPSISLRETILLGIYLLGLCALLIRLATGTQRARKLVRESRVDDGMRVSPSCAVPVTVGFFQPVVIFPEHWRQWSPAQLDAILAHEGEHVRRRDSLVQWLALLNRALFWFHPAAWWLERTLSGLAEQACDEVVLARGHNPGEYADYLLDLARTVAHSGARLKFAGMEMPGAGLPTRIQKIMQGGEAARLSRARLACVVAICVITCAAFTAGTLARVQQGSDQATKTERHYDGVQLLTPHDGVDFTAYLDDVSEAVKENWNAELPTEAKEGAEGKVLVRFEIQRDGTLSPGPMLEYSSGSKSLDDAAISAIRASAPFQHLPEAFKGPNIEVQLGFFYNEPISDTAPAIQSSTKFVLGDLKIEGDVHDRDGVQNRILEKWKGHGDDDVDKLAQAVVEIGVRSDFQDRGFFKVEAQGTQFELLDMVDGRRAVRVTVSVNEGAQYHLGDLNVNILDPPPATMPAPEAIQGMFQMKRGDLFNVSELRKGMNELKRWYADQGHSDVSEAPEFHIDDATRVIDVTVRVTEAPPAK